jgi:hypothetical protein
MYSTVQSRDLIEVNGGSGDESQQAARGREAHPQQWVTAVLGHAVHFPTSRHQCHAVAAVARIYN